jgi:hypothetical protein
VDARSVPTLYAGRVRLWQLAVVLLAGLLALLAAIATTPRGEQWIDELRSDAPAFLSMTAATTSEGLDQ